MDVLLRAVAEAEGLEATEEDLNELFQQIADAYQMDVETVKAQSNQEAAALDIKCRKAAELIYETGTDLPWSENQEVEDIVNAAVAGTAEEE